MGSGASSEKTANSTNRSTSQQQQRSQQQQQQQNVAASDAFQPKNDLVLLPGDADPASLIFLEKIAESDQLEGEDISAKLALLQEAEEMLPSMSAQNIDHLTVLLYHREGSAYQLTHNLSKAKEAYRKGVQIAELKVAERSPFLTMILQRYTACILALSGIWFMEEQGRKKKTTYSNSRQIAPGAAAPAAAAPPSDQEQQQLLQASALTTEAQIIAEAHRRSTGRKYGVDQERASETAILRCIELLELGLHAHSEHLLWPIFRLVDMYDELHLYAMALRCLRRAIGIVCQCYSYDHVQLPKLLERQERLSRLRDQELLAVSAVKLQSVYKMRMCMKMLSVTLQRRVNRHVLIPKASAASESGAASRVLAAGSYHHPQQPAAADPMAAAATSGEGAHSEGPLYAGPVFTTSEHRQTVLKHLLTMQQSVEATGGSSRLLFNTQADQKDLQAVQEDLRRRSKLRGWVAQVGQ